MAILVTQCKAKAWEKASILLIFDQLRLSFQTAILCSRIGGLKITQDWVTSNNCEGDIFHSTDCFWQGKFLFLLTWLVRQTETVIWHYITVMVTVRNQQLRITSCWACQFEACKSSVSVYRFSCGFLCFNISMEIFNFLLNALKIVKSYIILYNAV